MNAIGYRRLSDRDQSKYSLEYQEKAINDYCQRYDLDLIGLYTDNGYCSYTFDRPDYKELENFIKKHKGQARYLIIMDHDRFSRNLSEALAKITELENKFHIKVLATSEPIDIDTTDPYVFLQRAMTYTIANSELLRIRKRTRDGIRQAQLSGRYVNNAPFGYRNRRDDNGKGIIEVDDERAVIVQSIFRDYLAGKPMYEIFREVKKQGFKNSGNSAIQRILSNHVYAGYVKVNASKHEPERYIRGLHQPIVSEADYWLVQEMLGNKRPMKTQPKDEFPLRGILKCWCGKGMTAGYSKGKKKYYLYYRCIEHNQTNLPGGMLHEKFEELLETLSFNDRQIEYISKTAKQLMRQATKDNTDIVKARSQQLNEIGKKVDKLEERLMNDEIDAATYKKWLQKYSQEKAMLSNDIIKASNNDFARKWNRVEYLLPRLTSLKGIYKIATISRKQHLIRGVFKHNLAYSDGAFRTPSIEPAFVNNSLIAKEKGLLYIEQPSTVWDQVPDSSEIGS
ncbi:MAG: recombinase family protein [Chitinophagaceae bacterium]|nr:recombinase family protein [Chitinophagaceae bacterium]